MRSFEELALHEAPAKWYELYMSFPGLQGAVAAV